jgi:rubredoxin
MAVSKGEYRCPICGFVGFDEPPWDESGSPSYDICPSCGVEFGYDDFRQDDTGRQQRWRELRQEWITRGMNWTSTVHPQPQGWNAKEQLRGIEIEITGQGSKEKS